MGTICARNLICQGTKILRNGSLLLLQYRLAQAPNAGEMMANDVFETVQRKNLAWKEEEGILVNAWDRFFWRERGWVGAAEII